MPPASPSPFSPLWYLFLPLFALLDPVLSLFCLIPNAVFRHLAPSRLASRQRRQRGLLIVLSGIEGVSMYTWFMGLGALRSGWRGAIVDIPWGRGLWPIQMLLNVASPSHRQRWAERISRYIRRYQARYPGRPVHVIGHSAGTGLALAIAEQFADETPPDSPASLTTCVLLCPALSPTFDLRPAAKGCRRMISVQGPSDWFWLGLGTTLAGGCDRRWCPSAGVVGFHRADLPPNLLQRWWTPADLANGYLGNHCTAVLPGFITRKIMPLILSDPIGKVRPDAFTPSSTS